MGEITQNQDVQLRLPVDTTTAFDGAKFKGVAGFDTTKGKLVVCPADDDDFVEVGGAAEPPLGNPGTGTFYLRTAGARRSWAPIIAVDAMATAFPATAETTLWTGSIVPGKTELTVRGYCSGDGTTTLRIKDNGVTFLTFHLGPVHFKYCIALNANDCLYDTKYAVAGTNPTNTEMGYVAVMGATGNITITAESPSPAQCVLRNVSTNQGG
jgi:hypothetical protein